MDFGISLDPLAVPQRHTLYDSESDEEREKQHQNEREAFAVCENESGGASLTGKVILVGVGSTASIFVQSFVSLREEQAFSLKADIDKVQKGRGFLPGKEAVRDVTVFHCLTDTSSWLACLHATELGAEFCNRWTEKVIVIYSHVCCVDLYLYKCRCLVKGSPVTLLSTFVNRCTNTFVHHHWMKNALT